MAIIFVRRSSFCTITAIHEFYTSDTQDTTIMENKITLPLTGFETTPQTLDDADAQRKLFPATL